MKPNWLKQANLAQKNNKQFPSSLRVMDAIKKVKRKVQGVPQSQAAADPRHEERSLKRSLGGNSTSFCLVSEKGSDPLKMVLEDRKVNRSQKLALF